MAITSSTPTAKSPSSIWRNSIFQRLWLGLSISLIGDSFLFLPLQHAEYERTHSAGAASALVTAMMGGAIVMTMFAGTLVDRFNRRRLMMLADSARMLLLLVLIGLLEWQVKGGPAGGQWALPLILLTLVVFGTFTAVFQPALSMSLPTFMSPDELTQANAWIATSQRGGQMMGYALAGLFLTVASTSGALLLDGGTFIVSLLCVWWAGPFGAPPRAVRPPFWADLRDGARFVLQSRQLRSAVMQTVIINLTAGTFVALQPPVTGERLGEASWIWGLVFAANGLGAVIASLLLSPWIAKQKQRRGSIGLLMLALQGISQVGFANSHWLWVSLLLCAVNGTCNVCFNLTVLRFFQVDIPADLRGRVFGFYLTCVQLSAPVAMAVAGALADWSGSASLVYAASGAGLCISTLLFLRLPGLREI